MNRRSWSLTALSLALVTAIGACGGASAEPTAAPVDAMPQPSDISPGASADDGGGAAPAEVTCATLLPSAELENPAVLGIAPTSTDERGYPGAVDCTWTYTAPGASSQDFFQVLLNANPDNATLWQATASSEADGESGEPISIDGIGDESYTWVGQGDYRKLYVRRGERTLIVRGPSDVLVFANESSMIDLADRLFGRF